jgi:hypothetical protein
MSDISEEDYWGLNNIEDSVPEDQPIPVATHRNIKAAPKRERQGKAVDEIKREDEELDASIAETNRLKKLQDEAEIRKQLRNKQAEETIKKQTEDENRRNEAAAAAENKRQKNAAAAEKKRQEEEKRIREDKQNEIRKAAKQKEIEDAQAVTNAVYANAAQDVKRSVSRDSVTSLGNVTQNNGNQTNNANLLKLYANAYNQSHSNPIKPRPQSPNPDSPRPQSPNPDSPRPESQQTKRQALFGIGAPDARTLPYNKGYIYPQQQHPVQRLAQSPSQPLQSPRSPLLQKQPAGVQSPSPSPSPSPRSPQEYLVPGLKPAQRPSSAPTPQGQRQTKPNPAKTAWNNSPEIKQGPYTPNNNQNGNTNDQSIIKDEMWGNKRQLVPIEPKNSLKQRPVSAPASYFGNKSQTSVSDNQNSPRPMPSTQFSLRQNQNAQNYDISYESDASFLGDDDESTYDEIKDSGETAVPIIETTEDKIQNIIKKQFEPFKKTLLQIVEAILKTFEEIFKKYSTFFFDNVGNTLIQQDNVQPYAIFYIFLQHMIFKLTQIKNILQSNKQDKFDYIPAITNLNKQLKLQNDKNNMNSVFADSDEVTSTKKITLDPKFYKYIYEYVESFKLITGDLIITSSIVQKLTLFMGDSKSTESKQLIKAFKEILLKMVSILHKAYTNAFANYGKLLNEMKQNDIPITSKKHTYKIIYLYLFIMQYKFAYVKAQLEMALSSNPGKRSKRVVETDVIDYKKLSDDFLKLFDKTFKEESYNKIQKKLSKFDLFSV